MTGFGKSDIGRVRLCNEDSIFVQNSPGGCLHNFYIVADGMGGHKSGEVASGNAVKFFRHFVEYKNEIGKTEILDILVEGVGYANKKVYEMSKEDDAYTNMGTTFLVASVYEDKVFIAHVGDSRLYIVRNDEIKQITSDHTYVMEMVRSGIITKEEAKIHPDRNIITRALGIDEELSIDGIFYKILPDDIIIMCSDGLYEMIDDDGILSIVSDKALNLEERTEKLIKTANLCGGRDNISVVLIG